MEYGDAVRAARKRAGMTQAQLAARVGVSREQVSRIESGEQVGSTMTNVAIARELDLDLNLLKSHGQTSAA